MQNIYLYNRHYNSTLFKEKKSIFKIPETPSLEENREQDNNRSNRLDRLSKNINESITHKLQDLSHTTQSPDIIPISDNNIKPDPDTIHTNANIIDTISHSESTKELYETLNTLGDSRRDPEYRHFINMLSEDFSKEEGTGISFDNLQDTWLGNNTKKNTRGVFKALHHTDGVPVSRIRNTTFLEYKQNTPRHDIEKSVLSSITSFNREYPSHIQELQGKMQHLQYTFLNTSKIVIEDAKKLQTLPNIQQKIPNFFQFLHTKINSDTTTDFHPFVIQKKQTIISELKSLDILLSTNKIQKSINPPVWEKISDNEYEALNTYREVLKTMLEIHNKKTEKRILNQIENSKNIQGIEEKREDILQKIVQTKKQIEDLKTQYPVDTKTITQLEHDLPYLEQEKELYDDIYERVAPLDQSASVYNDIFENIWQEGKIVGTKVKNMSKTLIDLRKYHAWINEKMFTGTPQPQNPDVKAVLVASAYRGDISPQALHAVLLQLTHTNKNIEAFYEHVAKVIYSENDTEALQTLRLYLDEHPEFSEIEKKLLYSAQFWNDKDLAGNTARLNADNPLALTEANSRQAFQKNWGFNVVLAYQQYKKLNTQKTTPEEYNLQQSLKTNGQVLDLSLWVDQKTHTVNNSEQMKNYLSILLQESLRIAPSDDIDAKLNELPISQDKKILYKHILNKSWTNTTPDLLVFVETLKSEFQEEQNIEQKIGIQTTRAAITSAIKSVNDTSEPLSDTVSYIFDSALSGDMRYVGLIGALAYIMMKDTSGENGSFLLSTLKTGLLWGGGLTVLNSITDDMFDVNLFEKGKELITGKNKNIAFSPSSIALSEMKKIENGDENKEINSKEFERAGIVLSNGNVKETLDWYTSCKALQENTTRSSTKNIYSIGLPSGIEHFISTIYEDEGAIGKMHTKEEAAQKVYSFLDLYFRHISLQLDPTAGNGQGNATMGYKSIADEFYYPETINTLTYKEVGTNEIKHGYSMADVMRARTARETITALNNSINSIPNTIKQGAQSTKETIRTIGDTTENTTKTDEQIDEQILNQNRNNKNKNNNI